MSREIGRKVVGLIRQSGDTLSQQEDGTWEGAVKYLSTWPAVAYYAPQRNVSPHPDFPALICKSCQINRLKPGNYAEVVATYRGFVQPDTPPLGGSSFVEEVVTSMSDAPIETHPNFASVLGGTPDSPKNGAVFDENGKFLGFSADSLYAGIDSYLVPSTIYRKTTPTSAAPSDIGPVGSIQSPSIGGPGDSNWLFTGRTWRRDGGVYEVTEEYQLSPPGGWDPTIYT